MSELENALQSLRAAIDERQPLRVLLERASAAGQSLHSDDDEEVVDLVNGLVALLDFYTEPVDLEMLAEQVGAELDSIAFVQAELRAECDVEPEATLEPGVLDGIPELLDGALGALLEVEAHLVDGDLPLCSRMLARSHQTFHTLQGLAAFADQPSLEALAAEQTAELLAWRFDQVGFEASRARLLRTTRTVADQVRQLRGPDAADVELSYAKDPPAEDERVAGDPLMNAPQEATRSVACGRLDRLLATVGQLAVEDRALTLALDAGRREEAQRRWGHAATVIREVERQVVALCTSSLWALFERISEEVAELPTPVRFETSGHDVELESRVLEKLGDPLSWLVRRAIEGVAAADQRRASGKPSIASVTLRAVYQGAHVVIECADDGDATPSEGLQTLQAAVSAVRGHTVVDARPGGGTRHRIHVPLPSASLDATLLGCGVDRFLLPTRSMRAVVEPAVASERLPLVVLAEVLGLSNKPVPDGLIVIVDGLDGRFGLVVDAVLGREQVVVQDLPAALGGHGVFSGSAVASDGRVALVLNGSTLGTTPSSLAS